MPSPTRPSRTPMTESDLSASRTEDLPTSKRRQSSRSEGRRSPGLRTRREMRSMIWSTMASLTELRATLCNWSAAGVSFWKFKAIFINRLYGIYQGRTRAVICQRSDHQAYSNEYLFERSLSRSLNSAHVRACPSQRYASSRAGLPVVESQEPDKLELWFAKKRAITVE